MKTRIERMEYNFVIRKGEIIWFANNNKESGYNPKNEDEKQING